MADAYEVQQHGDTVTVAKRQWNGLVWVRDDSGKVKHFPSVKAAQTACDKLNASGVKTPLENGNG